MVECPVCGQGLKDDFGLVQCSQCQSTLFVDMDGSVQFNESPPPPVSQQNVFDEPLEPTETAYSIHDSHQSNEESMTPREGIEEGLPPLPEISPDELPEEFFESSMGESRNEAHSEPLYESADMELTSICDESNDHNTGQKDDHVEESEGGMEASNVPSLPQFEATDDSFLDEQVAPSMQIHEIETSESLDGLTEYANSEISQGREGFLRYRVLIEGIDSQDVREALRESLDDKNFLWDVGRLMSQVYDGKLALEDLSAVKASLLVNRIKMLPIEISWEQHAITEP